MGLGVGWYRCRLLTMAAKLTSGPLPKVFYWVHVLILQEKFSSHTVVCAHYPSEEDFIYKYLSH